MSAYLLHALLQVPKDIYSPNDKQVKKALEFIRQQSNDLGVVGCNDPDILDYPNYATAHTLMVLRQFGETKDSSLIERMSGSELINNTKMLKRFGVMENPALKAAYDNGLEKAKTEQLFE